MSTSLTFIELISKDAIGILITAALAGILVPMVKARMDDVHFRKQKDYEREIRLQENLLNAKIKLLESASAAYWKFYFCCITLTYSAYEKRSKFVDDHKKYQEGIWDAFANIRQVLSPAAYLLSQDEFKDMVGEFLHHLENVDFKIEKAAEEKGFNWGALHDEIHKDLASKINDTLHDLANALGVTPTHLARSGGAA